MFYSKSDHIIKLYENMLIYTQVQNIRAFLKFRKRVRLVRRIRDAVLTFVRIRRASLRNTLWWYKVSQTLTQYHSNSQRLERGEDSSWWRRCDTKQKPGMKSSKVSLPYPRGKTKSELLPAVLSLHVASTHWMGSYWASEGARALQETLAES